MWFVESDTLAKIQNAKQLSAEQIEYARQQYRTQSPDVSGLSAVTGNTAEIDIHGILTQEFDFWAWLFGGGGTLYPDIVENIQKAEADSSVSQIQLNIDSPGGHVEGLFDVLTSIKSASKPTRALVRHKAASAAYAIASQADEIVASSEASRVGSIGIAASFQVSSDQVDVASTESPNKRPDVTTEEGQAIVRAELDEMYQLFASKIAEGRKTTIENIQDNYGRGSLLLAQSALDRKMIDRILTSNETLTMNLETLQKDFPDIYQQAFQAGINHEHERVLAHLTMGEKSSGWDIAAAAIRNAEELDDELYAKYLEAGLRAQDRQNRLLDEPSIEVSTPVTDDRETVLKMVQNNLGVS